MELNEEKRRENEDLKSPTRFSGLLGGLGWQAPSEFLLELGPETKG